MTPAGAAPDPQVAASTGLISHFLKHPVPVADLPEYLRRAGTHSADGRGTPRRLRRLSQGSGRNRRASHGGLHRRST